MITKEVNEAKRNAADDIIRIVLEEYHPLIRQQVLKEVNDALRSIDGTEFTVDKHIGVAHCQRIVCDMMEGGE